ncbi:hypothetical protein DY000_02045814 [Brassica cretica]|uniref:Uncharacterized protein n=1 Tax=Brassica cretica TaxID=69181 RepID=A0ABQ7EYT5_BRACR|nr:hypothetical protein DY000_02045814 [Brassica cretica]
MSLGIFRGTSPSNLAHAKPPSCSPRRDEALATDHATIGVRTKPLEPPKVSSLRAREFTRRRRKSSPPHSPPSSAARPPPDRRDSPPLTVTRRGNAAGRRPP